MISVSVTCDQSAFIFKLVIELHVFCELYSCLVDAKELRQHRLNGIILSGGPNSVFDPLAPHLNQSVWDLIEELKLPVLGELLSVKVAQTHILL